MNRSELLGRRMGQAGMTLIELLVAMVVSSTILAALGGALMILMRTPPETVDHLTSSASAFQTGSTFADDIESAGPETGELAVARGTMGCGGDDNSVIRAVSRSDGDTQVRSYSIAGSGTTLERRVCSGATQTDALSQTDPSVGTVVRDLDPANPPEVICRATAVASPGMTDDQCRLVSMTVTTSTNLVFTVDGRRNTVQTPLPPTKPTKQQCTLGAIGDTYVTAGSPESSWNYGWDTAFVVQHGGRRKNAYLKIDLLSGCLDQKSGEPEFLPGNKTLKRATLKLTLLQKDPVSKASDDLFRLTTLPEWYTWHEDRMKFSDLDGCGTTPTKPPPPAMYPPVYSFPCQADWTVFAKPFQSFRVGAGSFPREVNIPVTDTVQDWYDGTIENRGWTIDRGEGPQVDQKAPQHGGWRFGSKENINYPPELIVEWD